MVPDVFWLCSLSCLLFKEGSFFVFRKLHIPHFYLLGWSVRSWVCEHRRFISVKLAMDISWKRGEINLAFMAISKIISAKLAVDTSRKRGEINLSFADIFLIL